MRIHVLGVGFDNMTMEQAVAEGVAMAAIRSTPIAEKVAPICVAMLSSKPAFWYSTV